MGMTTVSLCMGGDWVWGVPHLARFQPPTGACESWGGYRMGWAKS